jgi:hypothetical protein
MFFFDYIFYRVAKAYKSTKDSSAEFAAVCVVSLIEVLNLILMIGIYAQIDHLSFIVNKLITVLVCLIIVILNAFRYNKLNYDILKERWNNEDAETYQRKGTGVFFYILFSFIAIFTLAIWRANTK